MRGAALPGSPDAPRGTRVEYGSSGAWSGPAAVVPGGSRPPCQGRQRAPHPDRGLRCCLQRLADEIRDAIACRGGPLSVLPSRAARLLVEAWSETEHRTRHAAAQAAARLRYRTATDWAVAVRPL